MYKCINVFSVIKCINVFLLFLLFLFVDDILCAWFNSHHTNAGYNSAGYNSAGKIKRV